MRSIIVGSSNQGLASVTAVIMKSFIKRKVLAKDATNYEQQAEIIKHLAQILESPKAAFDSKRIIAEIVTLIIQKSPTVQSEEHLSGACFHLAFDLFQKGTKNSFLAGLMIILSNLEGGFKEAKRIGNLYRALSPNLLMCGTKSLNHLEPEFASWVQTGKFDIAELTAS